MAGRCDCHIAGQCHDVFPGLPADQVYGRWVGHSVCHSEVAWLQHTPDGPEVVEIHASYHLVSPFTIMIEPSVTFPATQGHPPVILHLEVLGIHASGFLPIRARNMAKVGADTQLCPTVNLPLLVRIKISQDGDMICIDTRNERGQ